MATIGIRLANTLFFVLSCSLAANVISDVGVSALIPAGVQTPPAARVDPPASNTWPERQIILDRNLFGAQVVDEPLYDAPPPEEEVQDSKLPYQLLGTIASDDRGIASAALEHKQTRKSQVVRIGDRLEAHPSVTVERIERRRIVLRNGVRLEQLELQDTALAAAKLPSPKRRPKNRTARNRRSRSKVQDRLKELTQSGNDRSPTAIFSQARILPKYEQGKMVGIELSKIEEGSFYEKAGLNDGDIVTNLNGVAIDNPSASKELIEAFTSSDTLTAEVRRANGGTETITVDADMLGQIGELE